MQRTSVKRRHGAICGRDGGWVSTDRLGSEGYEASGLKLAAQPFSEQLQNYKIVLMTSGWTQDL